MKTEDLIISNSEEKFDSRIEKMLTCVFNSLDPNHKGDYSKIILTMLVPQMVLYFQALDEIKKNRKLSSSDVYSRTTKSPEIQVLQKCNDQILSLLDKLCLSPMEKAKINRINKSGETSAQELLDALMK